MQGQYIIGWMRHRAYLGLGLGAGMGMAGWECLSRQERADVEGSLKSVGNSASAFWMLGKTVFQYQWGLRGLDSESEEYLEKRSAVHSETAERVLELSHRNKGLYLKLGQYIGNLDRIVPSEFTEVLRTLQDEAPSVPFSAISTVIEEDMEELRFLEFEEDAFSAASLAQVHRGVLRDGTKVAVKVQFPTLKMQTKWDLIVLRRLSQICDWLIKRTQYKELDVQKLYCLWTDFIQEELDFRIEVSNGQKTAHFFRTDPSIHVPHYYPQYCSSRLIVMEYIEGVRINDVQRITKELRLPPKAVADKLLSLMASMIFKNGFVHCDAHPGNILVRRAGSGFQIVLLDHGMYKTLDKDFLNSFCHLWLALIEKDDRRVRQHAGSLNLLQHLEYLPLLLMNRTRGSTKKIGDPFTEDERKQSNDKGLKNFNDIAQFIADLPPQLMFIIRASNLVAIHNLTLGGTRRSRLLSYARACSRVVFGDWWVSEVRLMLRIWFMEHFYRFYNLIFH